ncbi:MAG TPA: nucleotidyltransferase family protein [Candidatus Dormibacteraeota bacterium]|nr:nucleotidyltransferase family protein [Candidatus Dormibacteraeota bacterium]
MGDERMAGRRDDETDRADRSFAARGGRIATVLAGTWRRDPPALEMSEEALDDVTLGLLRSKTGALAWWRVRHSPLRTSAAGERLRAAYQNHGLQTALHAANLTRVVGRLRAAGVDPVLVKGPSIARLYPERGLRPFGDLDLSVRPDQHQAAAAVLAEWVGQFSPVDLHSGFKDLNARGWDDVYARSQLTPFGAIEVRILAAEDHLRFLCLHLLRHGAPSPLWLCDVAVALESRPQAFDWDLVLGSDRRQADWVACTIGLAHQLLGAAVDDTPVAARAGRLPRWLVPSVLEGWGRQCPVDYQGPELSPDLLSLLAGAATTVRRYWPNPVAATVHLRRRFSNYPRMPIQVVDAFARLARFSLRRLLGQRPDFDHL